MPDRVPKCGFSKRKDERLLRRTQKKVADLSGWTCGIVSGTGAKKRGKPAGRTISIKSKHGGHIAVISQLSLCLSITTLIRRSCRIAQLDDLIQKCLSPADIRQRVRHDSKNG